MKVIVAGLALCMTAAAQEVNYRYCVPVNAKVITSKSGGVYLRKSPSTKAARLMYGCIPETDDCTYMWSNERDEEYDAQYTMLYKGDMMMSLAQSGAFHRVYAGNTNYSVPAYVAASVTETVMTDNLTLQDLKGKAGVFGIIEKGPFMGTVLAYEEDELEGWSYILTGSIVDGKLILSHCKEARVRYNTEVKTIQYESDTDELVISFGPNKARQVTRDNVVTEMPDLNRMTNHEQCELLKKLDIEKKPNHLEIYVKAKDRVLPVYAADIAPQDRVTYKSKLLK